MHLMQNDTTPIQKTLRRRLKPEGQVALLGERGVELRHERIGVPTEFGGAASDARANRKCLLSGPLMLGYRTTPI